MLEVNGKFIKKVWTENTGGGCMVDMIELEDGRVIGINEECVVLYESMDQFYEAGSEALPSFTIPSKSTE